MNEILTGELVRWHQMQAFGFVRAEDGTEFFLHMSVISASALGPVGRGDWLRFTAIKDDRGRDRVGRIVAKLPKAAQVAAANGLWRRPERDLPSVRRQGL